MVIVRKNTIEWNRGAKQEGGGWGVSTPLNFGWGGVEHLSTPPDFEKKNFRGVGCP